MKQFVAWDQKPATVTTTTFKRIKDYMLALKESQEDRPVLVSAAQRRKDVIIRAEMTSGALEALAIGWPFQPGGLPGN